MKICLVGQNINGLLGKNTGGAERRITVLARNFARRGHQVTFVAAGYDGPEEKIDGVDVRSGWLSGHGVRGLRYLTYRLPRLRQVLLETGADAYITLMPTFYSATVMDAARRLGKPGLLGISSDDDLQIKTGRRSFITGTSFFELNIIAPLAYQFMYVPALHTASCIITQNSWQEKRCGQLKLRSRLIPNPVEVPPADMDNLPPKWDAVWVGNIASEVREGIKGFDDLARLVQKMPDVRFCIVGEFYQGLSGRLNELKQASHVCLTGPLSHAETMQVMAQSRLVINTSRVEGFSNVMLEGWALGRPMVSLNVDPDNLLSTGKLGHCAGGNLDKMSSSIRQLLSNAQEYQAVSQRGREYIQENYEAGAICEQYEALV